MGDRKAPTPVPAGAMKPQPPPAPPTKRHAGMGGAFLTHTLCGREVSIAVLNDDVALYVYCEHCRDLVEDGELHPKIDESVVRLRVDRSRVRPTWRDEGRHTTGETYPGREDGL